MSKSKIVQTIIFIVALAVALVLSINSTVLGSKVAEATGESDTFTTIMNLFLVISLLCGIVYMVFGASKDSAVYYKLFMWSFVVAEASMIASAMAKNDKFPISLVLPYVIGLITAIIITCSKDLGKNKSIVAVTFAIACKVLVVAYDVVIMGSLDSDTALMYLGSDISRLMLAVTACMLVLAKYRDKEARGTK